MSPGSDASERVEAIAEIVVGKIPKIRPGETFEIVCLNGTFPFASAFARATRRAGARALIRLQDKETAYEPDSNRGNSPIALPSRLGTTIQEWSELLAETGPTLSAEEGGRFLETMEGLLAGRRITITRPEANQVELAVGVEDYGRIDAFYFGRPDGSDRNVPLAADESMLNQMVP